MTNSFEYNEQDLEYFRENISYLIEYFYKNFYMIFKKYCKDIAQQLIIDKKVEFEQFNSFVEQSIMKEANIQEKDLKYMNNSINNNIFIKNIIISDIDKLFNNYEKKFDNNTDFKTLSLNNIFYENFYGKLLEYCGLKVPNFNKLGYKDITTNGIIDKLISSLKVSNNTKKRMFKDIVQKLNNNKNRKFANNKQLSTKNINTEKDIKKNPIQKQALKNIKNINENNSNVNKSKLNLKTEEIKNNNIKHEILNNFLLMKNKNNSLKKCVKEKIEDKKQSISTELKPLKLRPKKIRKKIKNKKIKFNILNPLIKLGKGGNTIIKNGLKLGMNTIKAFGKAMTNINNRIGNIVGGKKLVNNSKNKKFIKNKTVKIIKNNGKNNNNIVIIQRKNNINIKEVHKNREILSKIKNANKDLDNRMQKSKSNSIGLK